ncbi:methyl-accepting chemotaxis protein [Celerinatantimonas yamalensis]|uniref:Methyl-accepting chemotaxis protein n=1 Tax=Celerinatantimonas yamalensis TaxID=559956 RepID=A0ABW9G750_9GAMM
MLGINRFIENLSIGAKIASGFFVVLILAIIVGLTGIQGVGQFLTRSEKVALASKIDQVIGDAKIARSQLVQTGTNQSYDKLSQVIKQLHQLVAKGKQTYRLPTSIKIVNQLEKELTAYESTFQDFSTINRQRLTLNKEAKQLQRDILAKFSRLISQLREHDSQLATIDALLAQHELDQINLELYMQVRQDEPFKSDEIQQLLDRVVEKTTQAQLGNPSLQQLQQELIHDLLQAQALIKSYSGVHDAVLVSQNEFSAQAQLMHQNTDALTHYQDLKRVSDGQQIKQRIFVVLAAVIILSIFMTWWIRRIIVGPIHQLMAVVASIATGDLTQQVKTDRQDEIGQLYVSMDEMSQKLAELIRAIGSGISQLSSASEQLNVISQQGVERAGKQQQQTDQVATAINEMTVTVHEVANNAESAAHSTDEANSVVSQGNQMLDEAVALIRELAEEITETNEAMVALKNQTDQVGQVLDVIRSVAEQTNLLALNAAIEAARAGESGRGFAVVADEVRSLASRTQSSAEEIHHLIEQLQQGAEHSSSMMQMSQKKSSENAQNAQHMMEMFEQISTIVDQIRAMNQQIATAAEEQSQVSESINQNIMMVRDLGEETNIASKESAQAVVGLNKLSHQLQGMIEHFKVA